MSHWDGTLGTVTELLATDAGTADHSDGALASTAARLAALLTGGSTAISDPGNGSDLVFEETVALRTLDRGEAPADAWAIDGGQALVADGRCLQVVVTRAARVRFQDRIAVLEDEGELRPVLLGLGEQAHARAGLALDGLADDCAVDINLLRDRWEWDAVERAVAEADRGGLVLVDGDLQPDWRIPSGYLARLFADADRRGVMLAGVVKHSSLARGGAPLLGALEREAAELFGHRSTWWAPVARTRPDVHPGIRVVVARLDPDARFAFRIDLPGDADPAAVLPSLSALSDDAAFPGYPYPLSVADRLAGCPGWVREEVRFQLDDLLEAAGVPWDVRERAFADRHRLMERA